MVGRSGERTHRSALRISGRTLTRRPFVAAVVAAVLLGLSGCATVPVFVSPKLGPLQRVAVLPFSNETNDLDGPVFVRKLIQEGLVSRGVTVVPTAEIDQKLKDNGFTDGGQLRAAKPEDIGQWVGADTLFYTTLVDFGYINVGFYWQRKVTLVGRLVDAKTGERLLEAEKSWATRWIVTDKEKAKNEFIAQLAIQAAEKLMKTPLAHESRIVVGQILDAIPYR